ncbi:BadF/BadG/BcrA/BcrD ATPase family protein [Aliiruegeria lutimaris]|uniref:Glucosamine kinase n=1 Tax=Aliiruegeria lutimaris TaxID=571298 RepID=A0A1G8YWM8_9RHOB|nr:BadF/BadG/BcrA/BcrD ATPase family protein [Aliiruegeria lutimaris]SDK07228.1 glucosamine kinase [Aliiruegeria lutimaris]
MVESRSPLLIGVDGGGTSCRAALQAGGRRFEAQHGPANVSTDFEGAIATIRSALEAVAAQAGLSAEALSQGYAHIGLAGVQSPAMADKVAACLPLANVAVTEDRPTSIAGALGDADGAVAAIGTGSFIGCQKAGKITGLGGWGFHLGDQASGAWLMHRAYEELMLALDGLAEMTPFATMLLDTHGGDAGDVVRFSLQARPADYALNARKLVKAAEAEDPLAARLMTEGASYIRRGLDRLGWQPGEPLCLTGGLGPSYARWLGLSHVPPRGTALDGALTLAARLQEGAR